MIETSSPQEDEQKTKWRQSLENWLLKLKDTNAYSAVTEFVEKMRPKIEENPRVVIEELASLDEEEIATDATLSNELEPETEILEENEEQNEQEDNEVEQTKEEEKEFEPLTTENTFDQMPILSGEEQAAFNKGAIEMYGEIKGRGKWSTVLIDNEDITATKIYNRPDLLLNAYDAVFMSRFGGKAGLPNFEGFVPNGYKMEAIDGMRLLDMLNNKKNDLETQDNSVAMKNLLTTEQAQAILSLTADYHKETGRVHGDLTTTKGMENIMFQDDGTPRLVDTEWERIGDQTPQSELEGLHEFFSKNMEIKNLKKPTTIGDEEAQRNLDNFEKEVEEMIERDSVYKNRIIKFKDQKAEFKVEDGQLLSTIT
jgi:hypothetical protein